jgi:hypothetical protein
MIYNLREIIVNKVPYHHLPGFEHVYLEDTYVLDIVEEPTQLVFTLEVVLTEGHPLYQGPSIEAQYCYREALLKFSDIKKIIWTSRHFQAFTDASGSVDYGNIDIFYKSGFTYHLEGDWGSVNIESSACILVFP